METFRKWKPSSFAPVVMSFAPRKRSSAKTWMSIFLRVDVTAPRLPGCAPVASKISSAVAGRKTVVPIFPANLASFN